MISNSKPYGLFVEFTPNSAIIAFGENVSTIDLEHEVNGRLAQPARDALKEAINRIGGSRRPMRAFCAIGVRGVSLRTVKLPPSKPENLRQLLSIQIEKEFPLGPDQLAWGFQRTNTPASDSQPREYLLVAAKKELIEDYAAVLAESGVEADFTVGILSLAALVARTTSGAFLLLSAGPVQTEVVRCENGVPSLIRNLPIGSASEASVQVNRLRSSALPGRVFVCGVPDRVQWLAQSFEPDIQCEILSFGEATRLPAVLVALEKLDFENSSSELLTIRTGGARVEVARAVRPLPVKWIATAAALIVGMIALRYVEPMIRKPALAAKIARARDAKAALPPIEQELEFLRHLESSRPAYLNAITVLADAIPGGIQFDALTLDRRGGFTFRATLANPQQASDLRVKLLESGLFVNVILEEQTPVENNRKLIMRISARWRPDRKTPSKTIDKIVADSVASKPDAPAKSGKR